VVRSLPTSVTTSLPNSNSASHPSSSRWPPTPEASLGRPDYLNLLKKELSTPQAVLAATDEELLACMSGSNTRLRILRDAAAQACTVPKLDAGL
jgi:hypothetical protein